MSFRRNETVPKIQTILHRMQWPDHPLVSVSWLLMPVDTRDQGINSNYSCYHYCDVIMNVMSSQITSLAIVYSTVYSDVDQRKHQSSASLTFVQGIHRWPVNSPHKWPVTRKNVSIWWRHHDSMSCHLLPPWILLHTGYILFPYNGLNLLSVGWNGRYPFTNLPICLMWFCQLHLEPLNLASSLHHLYKQLISILKCDTPFNVTIDMGYNQDG